MEARLHDDLAGFHALVRPLLEADPVTHTVALTVLATLLRVPEATHAAPLLVSVHEDEALLGAALYTPPRGLITSALPARCAPAVGEVLASVAPALPDATGPRPRAEAFTRAWSVTTGATVRKSMPQRLFALDRLARPVAVAGAARLSDRSEVVLLASWRSAFAAEATGGLRGAGTATEQTECSFDAGSAMLLWEVGGEPVAWASASAPVAGMSRIGPVYTPPEHRDRGYAGAVTAAAAAWALDAGARHVVLSPTSRTRSPTTSTRGSASARCTRLSTLGSLRFPTTFRPAAGRAVRGDRRRPRRPRVTRNLWW